LLERERRNYQRLEGPWPPLDLIPLLLVAGGAMIVAFGLVMLVITVRAPRRP
jgi:hypothetical protein